MPSSKMCLWWWLDGRIRLASITLIGCLWAVGLQAASTGGAPPVGQPIYPGALNSGLLNGDYVSNVAAPGLGSPWEFFVEVPPGTGQLFVQFFDADIGAGANLDFLFGVAANTTVQYRLFDPNGLPVFTATVNPGFGAGFDNVWVGFPGIANPIPGHWRIDIDQTFNGTQMNGVGVRAHDGNPAAGGVELNVYSRSHMPPGMIQAFGGSPQFHDFFPYVTSGCTLDVNDFDGDSGATPLGFNTLNSATTPPVASQFTAQFPISGATVWRNTASTGWTDDANAAPYGIWHLKNEIALVTSSNWLTLFLGDELTANAPTGGIGPPPTGQPEANTHRIYLPPDGFVPVNVAFPGVPTFPATAPVKPFVEQYLQVVGGANPPQPGQTTRVSVEVFITNPTPFPIAFSAAAGDVVTANVPGPAGPAPPRVVYAGNAAPSQGTVTAAPAIGGIGDVVWDPGTVAAGTVEVLYYEVEIEPAFAGQRLLVTGAVGSGNGTRARYVDETCAGAGCTGTQLANATFTFGELCPLAVEVDLITPAALTHVDAGRDREGRTVLHWETGSEPGVVGFHLVRFDEGGGETRITERPIPSHAALGAAQGGRYAFVDGGAPIRQPGEVAHYAIDVIEASGPGRRHGPFALALDETVPGEAVARAEHPLEPSNEPAPTLDRAPATSTTWAVQLGVETTGIHRIAATDLAAQWGLEPSAVADRIAEGALALSESGTAVAWAMDGPGDALVFFGEGPKGEYAAHRIYRLEMAAGLTMANVDGTVGAPAPGSLTYLDSLEVEVDAFAAVGLPLDPEAGYWFWKSMAAGGAFATSTVTLEPEAAEPRAGGAVLELDLHGASSSGVADEHHVEVRLHGALVGEARFSGIAPHRVTIPVDGVLTAGANPLELTAVLDPGVPQSFVYLDAVRLTYPRRFDALDRIAFRGDGHPRVRVSGLGADPWVLAVDDPKRPERVAVTAAGDAFDLEPASADTHYRAASTSALLTPSFLRLDEPSDLTASENAADVLILTPDAFAAEAERLADHRRAEGLLAQVVAVEDVMDEFAHGNVDPWAIRRFLAHAVDTWVVPPRWVLLAGGGTWDHRDRLGLGGNHVPVVLTSTAKGLFAADNRLVDFDDDGAPDIAIGRFPASSVAALGAAIDKTLAVEQAGPATGRALLAAGAPDGAVDFTLGFDGVARGLPEHYARTEIDLGAEPVAAARATLFDAWQLGLDWFDYHGHGSTLQLGNGGLLTRADAPSLTGPTWPVVTAMSCTVNRFEVPGFTAIGAALVTTPAAGAVAVWSASGTSVDHGARRLAARAYHEAFDGGTERLGDVVRRTLAAFDLSSGPRAMREVYTLLGDPALRLTPAPAPPLPGGFNDAEAGLPYEGLVLTCSDVFVRVPAAGTAEVACALTAEGPTGGRIDLSAIASPGWTAVVSPPSLELTPGTSETITVTIGAPNAAAGSARVDLDASSVSSGDRVAARLDARIDDLPWGDGFESGDTSAWSVTVPAQVP